MFRQLLSIARNALVESLRQPIFLLLILVSGVCQFMTTWSTGFAMGYDESAEVQGDNKLLLDIGMGTIFVLGMLLAAFTATAVLSREIENKTVLTVVSKPVGRPVLLIGKYLGVSGAIGVALVTMLVFLLFGIRHGVMSTAADDIDQPVMVFSLASVVLALGAATWCNFFYGWSFPQTAVLLLLPFTLIGYVLVLAIGKKWAWQALGTDFKPQVVLTCACLACAVFVMTAVAVVASARLGQVMTIVVCAGVFLASLLLNHIAGRHAFRNELISSIKSVELLDPTRRGFDTPGETATILLATPPKTQIKVGDSFYYGPSPSGAFLSVPPFAPFAGDLSNSATYLGAAAPPAVVVTEVPATDRVVIRNLGARAVPVKAPPTPGDSVFLSPTQVNMPALAAYCAFPNLQHFWLLDAVTQNQKIPWSHVGLIAAYAAAQIGAILSLGVILFQRRDVG